MSKTDFEKIEDLHMTDMKASLEQDFETLISLWTDDGVLILPNQEPVRGIEALRKMMEEQREESKAYAITEYVHDFQEVQIIGEWAFEWGTYRGTMVMKDGGKPVSETGKLMRVLKKHPGGAWKVARAIGIADTKEE